MRRVRHGVRRDDRAAMRRYGVFEGEPQGDLTGSLELISFENEKDSWDLEEPEKLTTGAY